MPHLASASVQDFHSSTKLAFNQLSQRYSDDFFSTPSQAQATWGPKKNRPQPLEQLLNGGLPSPPASESDEADMLSLESNSKHHDFVHRLPRTPSPDKESTRSIGSLVFCHTPTPELQTSSNTIPVSDSRPLSSASKPISQFDALPFPAEPSHTYILESSSKDPRESCQSPKRRCVSAEASYLTPPASPDRYISNRYSPQPRSSTFRTSKSPQQLSSTERLLRQNSASPDPFRSPTHLRAGRRVVSDNESRQESRLGTRATSGTNVFGLPRTTLRVQDRQPSAGAVWNVGGNSATSPTGPIQGVPNGRGGLIGSGTNAPLYTSRFLEGETPDQDLERLEGRLAIALEIDQTNRVLDIPASPARRRYAGTESVTSKRKYPFIDLRTRWKGGVWVQEGKSSCEFAFVLSIRHSQNPQSLSSSYR